MRRKKNDTRNDKCSFVAHSLVSSFNATVRESTSPSSSSFFWPQLPREWCGGDSPDARAAPRPDPAALRPAPGGHARLCQLQHGDAGGEGFLVPRRGAERQPDVAHQQGAAGQNLAGVRSL